MSPLNLPNIGSEVNWAVLIPIVCALIAPMVTYIVAAKRMSGKIATSDAGELWEESKSIREDYRERILAAAERTVQLEARVGTLEGINNQLQNENFQLKHKVEQLEELIVKLRETITTMQGTIVDQRKEIEGR